MNNKYKHTPGPWEYKHEFEYDNGYPIYQKHYVLIGEKLLFIDLTNSKHNTKPAANARLIAAAPEMLEALIECIVDEDWSAHSVIKIIEKATGQKFGDLL